MTLTAAYLYPWDIDGDPAAAGRVAALGVGQACLAAAYHEVLAVTPFHPRHRVVTRNSAVYYQPDPAHWQGAALRPAVHRGDGETTGGRGGQGPDHAGRSGDGGSFGKSALELRAAGLRVSAWLVITHNETIGAAHPEAVTRNAFGDPYPWALCPASPAVREYAALLAAEVAALPYVDGIELEACGWYGYDHGFAHDKARLPGGPLDLCFCGNCERAYREAGVDCAPAREAVRAAIDGRAPLPAPLAGALASVRDAIAAAFLREVIAAARRAAPAAPVLVHTHPDPRECGSNPGFDGAAAAVDGVVLGAPASPPQAARLVAQAVSVYRGRPERIAVTLPAVRALGGASPGTLGELARAVVAAGAGELRFYHAGLASAADLAAIRETAAGLG
jgi:hypothetical protein